MGRAILLRGGPGIGLRSAPRSPCRNVEDGTQAQGAPSVAKVSRCITKRFQPDYRRYLRTVSRCVRLPTHGFPSVVVFGGDDRASADEALGRGAREHSSHLFEATGYAWVQGTCRGFAVGFGAFAVALLKRVIQRRACVPLAGAVFVVLLCAVGLEGKAQAQSVPPAVTNVSPNTGPTSGGTNVTITGTNFSGATAVRFGSNAAGSFTVNSATQITATSPAGSGTVDVTVTTEGGT